MSEPLLFAVPPTHVKASFEATMDQVDWRPYAPEALARPLVPGMARPSHHGAIQIGKHPVRCYKLLGTGEKVLNARDLALVLGVSVDALTDRSKWEEQRRG